MIAHTFYEVGKSERLKGKMLERYVEYMKRRWGKEEHLQCKSGYAKEWAWRFYNRIEYSASDNIGRRVLQEIDSIE